MKIVPREKLPSGYSLDEEGKFIHKIPKEDILEMIKKDNLIFLLSALNIIQAIFIFILVFAHFYNH